MLNTKPQKNEAQATCPRCESRLWFEPIDGHYCVQCGYQAYDYDPSPQNPRERLFSGTVYRLRYAGDSKPLRSLVMMLEVRYREYSRGHTFVEVPICPYCELDMVSMGLSGSHMKGRNPAFQCSQRHIIHVLSDQTGYRGWK